MSVLAIETATERMGVALVNETRVLSLFELLAERPHAVELPQAVARVLHAGGETLGHLEGIAIDIGPGSFTGLRIGLSFVKALTLAKPVPVIAVPSLDVLAAAVPFARDLVCSIIDAKQRKVYAAFYRADGARAAKQSDYSLWTLEELFQQIGSQRVLFVGDGVGVYRQQLAERFGERATFADPEWWYPQAAVLGRLGLARLKAGQRDNPRDLVPMYLHPMTCTIKKPVPMPSVAIAAAPVSKT